MALAININNLLNKQKIESNPLSLRKVGILGAYITVYVLSPMISTTLVVIYHRWYRYRR